MSDTPSENLPDCRHRGPENVYGRFSCSSPLLPFRECRNSSGVRRGQCSACPVADRGAPRPFDKPPAPPKGSRPLPRPSRPPAPLDGPGTELESLIKTLGLVREGCGGCQGLRKQMNRWGADGCRGHREQILTRLRKAYKELTAGETAAAAWAALWSGLAFRLDPRDPAAGLLDEALRRWETRAPVPAPDPAPGDIPTPVPAPPSILGAGPVPQSAPAPAPAPRRIGPAPDITVDDRPPDIQIEDVVEPLPPPPEPVAPAPGSEPDGPGGFRWAYGVTTCAARRDTYLPATLKALAAGGFPAPRLFADGVSNREAADVWEPRFGLPVTARGAPPLRTAGSWVLALYELYYRDPRATHYALFQDDLTCLANLRAYLEANPCPAATGYWNLITSHENEHLTFDGVRGWAEAKPCPDPRAQYFHGKRQQGGRGAVALVFPAAAVPVLLGSAHLAGRPARQAGTWWYKIDGAVVEAMNQAGWREWVHVPSLVAHTGAVSTLRGPECPPFRPVWTFPGAGRDALALLPRAGGGG